MTAVLQRIDYSYLDGESAKLDVMRSVIKTLSFLGLFSDEPIQESNSYLSTLSNVM